MNHPLSPCFECGEVKALCTCNEYIDVEDWQQLAECKSNLNNVELEIDFHYGNGWIKQDGEKRMYLSTHTFYEGWHNQSTEILRNYGFNVALKSWG